MSGPPCSACTSPDRQEIDRALVAPNAVNRRIAARFGLSEQAIRRHRASHLPERLALAVGAEDQAEALSVRRDLMETLPALKRAVKQCEVGAPSGLFAAWNQWRPALDLAGKVTREIQPESSVTVQVALWQELGVRDKDEAIRRLRATEAVEGLDEHALAERALAALAWYLDRFPERRGWATSRLLPSAEASIAGNGATLPVAANGAGGRHDAT